MSSAVELTEKWMANQEKTARKAQAFEELEYYKGLQLKYIEKNPVESTEDFKDRMAFLAKINLTQHVIDHISMLGKPTIELENFPPATQQAIEDTWNKADTESLAVSNDRFSNLNGTTAIVVGWNELDRELRLIPWTADEFSLLPDDQDVRQYKAFSYTTRMTNADGEPYKLSYIYTPDEIVRMEDGEVVEHPGKFGGKNPYGLMVVQVFKNSEEWSTPYGIGKGYDLVEINGSVNNMLSDLYWGLKMQAFSVLVLHDYRGANNQGGDGTIPFGPGCVIQTEGDGRAEALNLAYDADKVLNSLKTHISAYYATVGLHSANPVHMEIDAQSGVAIMLNKADVLKYNELRGKMFAEYYRRLILKMGAVHVYHTTGTAWTKDAMKKAVVDVTFERPSIPVPTDEKLNERAWEYSNNLRTPIDDIMAEFGLTKDEAIDRYKENKALMAELKGIAAIDEPEPANVFGTTENLDAEPEEDE